ncbi:MAG TPA: hypothetical protein VNF69_03230, partial [Burkholderiales bacterium]|nr:hypothetical protein [Burkholderiales bacterium]
AGRAGIAPRLVAPVFFVWLSVFNLFVVSVFWSFMADLFDAAQAARLYCAIAAGGSCGAITGPAISALAALPLGVPNLLLLSTAFLAAATGCIRMLLRWARAHPRQGGSVARRAAQRRCPRLTCWQSAAMCCATPPC